LCGKLGLVLAFMVFGLVAGANGLGVFMADHDPDPMHAMALAPAEAATAETKAVEAALARKTSSAGRYRSPYRESITEQPDGDCSSGKARNQRPVQAVNERPAIAAIPIGHRDGPAVLPSEPEILGAATPNIPDDSAKPEDAAEAAPASSVKESAAVPPASAKTLPTRSKYVQRHNQDNRKYVQRRNRNEYSPSPSYSNHNYRATATIIIMFKVDTLACGKLTWANSANGILAEPAEIQRHLF
jgi:hypothetical protein